jgi:uncharacterized protein YhfF
MLSPNKPQIDAFVDRFRRANPLNDPEITTRPIVTDYFGDSPEMADRLLEPVFAGIKTATCSCLWEWEYEKEPLLKPGHLAVIIDGSGNARCILETIELTIMLYNKVDTQFAYDEGEGERTLESWRRAHWNYFARTLPRIAKEPTQDMPLLCERFRMIYNEGPGTTA